MGVDHVGTGDKSPPPEFGVEETVMQIVPLRFCHIGTKKSVLWPSKYTKIRFRPGLCPGPRWESSRHSSRPSSRLRRDTRDPSPYPIPLGTNPPSALAMRPRRIPARSTPMFKRQVFGRYSTTLYRIDVTVTLYLACEITDLTTHSEPLHK